MGVDKSENTNQGLPELMEFLVIVLQFNQSIVSLRTELSIFVSKTCLDIKNLVIIKKIKNERIVNLEFLNLHHIIVKSGAVSHIGFAATRQDVKRAPLSAPPAIMNNYTPHT